jgi:hypothetical protein
MFLWLFGVCSFWFHANAGSLWLMGVCGVVTAHKTQLA